MTIDKIEPTREAAAADDDDERMILDSVDRFLEKDVRPYVRELERTDTYPGTGSGP